MVALRRVRVWAFRVLVCGAFGLGLVGTAGAALVGTQDAIDASSVAQARAQVKALVQRPELAGELRALGATPAQAAARVDAMTDTEVLALAGKVGDLPAGGRLSNNELILLLVIILLIAL